MNQIRLRAPGSNNRIVLADSIPLEKPLSIRISPSNICNFRCEYCSMSRDEFRLSRKYNGIMDYKLFKEICKDIKSSFGKVKHIFLVGMGEPLLNSKIADMVKYINFNHIAETVEIVTNGTLLTHKLSEELVNSGLTRIRISVNGLSDKDFKHYCNAEVNFEQFVEQLSFLYSIKGKTQIYAKIINYMVKDPTKYNRFFDTFSKISDVISVENLTKGDSGIDYEKIAGEGINFNQTQSNTELIHTNICSMPFYTLLIDELGDVFPCCTPGIERVGNIKDMSLSKIWNSTARYFQEKMLDGVKQFPFCASCESMQYRVYPEDALDNISNVLKEKYRRI